MKHVPLIFLVLLSTITCVAQNSKSNFPVYNSAWLLIYGPDQNPVVIRSNHIIKEEIYDYTVRNNDIKDSTLLRTIFYDSRGNITRKITGAIKKISTDLYSYDSSNRLTAYSYSCSCDKTSPYVTEYKIDDNRPFTRHIHRSDTSVCFENQLYYNADHQLIKRYQQINRKEFVYEKYTYDEKGREAQTDILDDEGSILYSFSFAYDDAKRTKTTTKILKNYSYVADNDEYNDKWQLIRKWYDSSYVDFTYNPDGTINDAKRMYFGKAGLLRHYYFKE